VAPTKTHFDVLGVGRSATPKQIKDAYIRLVKRHHPDRRSHVPEVEPDVDMTGINLAYSVLKDAGRRREYELELDRRSLRQPAIVARARQSPGLRLPVAILAGAMAAIIFAQLLFAGRPVVPPSDDIEASAAALVGSAGDPGDSEQVAFTTELRREAANAMGSSLGEALRTSTRCFAHARDDARPASAEPCIVFDLAYLYWNQSGRIDRAPLYFQEQNVERRAVEALAGFGAAGASERVQALRNTTLDFLLARVRALSATEQHRSEALEALARSAGDEGEANLN
jgi:hypothetical protein